MDSGVLFGSHDMIEQRVRETAKAAKEMGVRHVMNLGHGIMQARPLAAARWAGSTAPRFLLCLCPAAGSGNSELCCLPPLRHASLLLHLSAASRPHPTHAFPTLQGTPEEAAEHFFKVAKSLRYADL